MFHGRTSIFIKEEVALLKLTDTYHLLDADTGAPLGQAKDEPSMKWLRLFLRKALLPTDIRVYPQGQGSPLLTVHKHVGFLRTRLTVHGAGGNLLARLRSKVFSLGGAFEVNDPQGRPLGELKGDWKGWDFTFTVNGQVFGRITKKWAGLAKELFTNADHYLVMLEPAGQALPEGLALLTGLALAVDVIYKERQG